jgi:hypothetical protein
MQSFVIQAVDLANALEFKFTSLLTAELLQGEIHRLRRSTTDKLGWVDIEGTTEALVTARMKLGRSPFDPGALQAARELVRGCKFMEEVQAEVSLKARAARLHAINAHLRLWRWLDGEVRTTVVEKLSGHATDAQFDLSWVARLADAVRTVYAARTETKVFDPSDFGITSTTSDDILQPFTLSNTRRGRYPPTGDDLTQLVGSSVVSIVSSWLGEHSATEQKRAWFVDAIANHIGEEALTLDLTWNMVRDFKPIYALPREHAYGRQTDHSLIGSFISALQDHPITDPDSLEGQTYRLYCDLVNHRTSPLDVLPPLLDISPAWPRFRRMLELAMEYIHEPTKPLQNGYQTRLKEEEDYYLPFRNDATSRKRSMAEAGPYAKDTIRQVNGIFSAIVWRACTYRSGFARDVGMVFNDWTDLDRKIEDAIRRRGGKATRTDSYFCKKDAYGQPAGRRSVEYAAGYWKTLQDLNWEAFSKSEPSFTSCMQFFRPPGKNLSKRFPQLGPLGCFMLVGDLASAGICQQPTALEAATYIVDNGMGSLAGLKLLGLVPERGAKGQEQVNAVERGLEELIDITSSVLDRSRYTGELNYILLEHMLCKFQRACDQNLL